MDKGKTTIVFRTYSHCSYPSIFIIDVTVFACKFLLPLKSGEIRRIVEGGKVVSRDISILWCELRHTFMIISLFFDKLSLTTKMFNGYVVLLLMSYVVM